MSSSKTSKTYFSSLRSPAFSFFGKDSFGGLLENVFLKKLTFGNWVTTDEKKDYLFKRELELFDNVGANGSYDIDVEKVMEIENDFAARNKEILRKSMIVNVIDIHDPKTIELAKQIEPDLLSEPKKYFEKNVKVFKKISSLLSVGQIKSKDQLDFLVELITNNDVDLPTGPSWDPYLDFFRVNIKQSRWKDLKVRNGDYAPWIGTTSIHVFNPIPPEGLGFGPNNGTTYKVDPHYSYIQTVLCIYFNLNNFDEEMKEKETFRGEYVERTDPNDNTKKIRVLQPKTASIYTMGSKLVSNDNSNIESVSNDYHFYQILAKIVFARATLPAFREKSLKMVFFCCLKYLLGDFGFDAPPTRKLCNIEKILRIESKRIISSLNDPDNFYQITPINYTQ